MATIIIKCKYFDTTRIVLTDYYEVESSSLDSFRIIMCLKGLVEITDNNGNKTSLSQGETVLVPATTKKLILKGNAELLSTTAI